MSIIARRNGAVLFVVSGNRRLNAQLLAFGKSTVTEAETLEELEVHEVDGQILVLHSTAAAAAKTIAASAITKASSNTRKD